MAILLLSSLVAGCLSDSVEEHDISLVVNHENTNGTIVESYVDGEHIATTNVSLNFDFSNTVSNEKLVTFGIEYMDDGNPIEVDPANETTITVEFSNHGIYEINAYAIDELGQQASIGIVIRIELRIEWSESSTYEPKNLVINPIPENGGPAATSILIDSTVENPVLVENIGGGQDVEITWRLVDQQDIACQSRSGVIHEGDDLNWKTIHFNTYEIHDLRVSYDDGQDYIDVNHIISIEYEAVESEANPSLA
ncbi:MAG: hypothetical protein VX320_02095 [Candidatus Thermoplasmatota archaeon]|nr:hypothetical protein [Candidatus Thermoplasmatota archaeon]MEE3082866.1 hypothetical protein [Candidatus Thermoplasmatota archaeon]